MNLLILGSPRDRLVTESDAHVMSCVGVTDKRLALKTRQRLWPKIWQARSVLECVNWTTILRRKNVGDTFYISR